MCKKGKKTEVSNILLFSNTKCNPVCNEGITSPPIGKYVNMCIYQTPVIQPTQTLAHSFSGDNVSQQYLVPSKASG